MTVFSISAAQEEKINNWLTREINPAIVALQKTDPYISQFIFKDAEGNEWPYDGVSGGNITYQFTPTSLGMCTTVRHFTGALLDITVYDEF